MSDVLAPLSEQQVAAFYRRLASFIDKNKGQLKTSLAARLLNHWLDNRDPNATYEFDAPDHLKTHPKVIAAFHYHRAVYLTEKKARLGGGVTKWAGAIPRLQGQKPFTPWNGSTPLTMDYQSLVEMPLTYQLHGSDADRDLLYSLRGFQLKTFVTLSPAKVAKSKLIKVEFTRFDAQVLDRYDWDYTEYMTVPNPDFGSQSQDAVSPESQKVRVYHRNAKRLEDAKLAAPYNIATRLWRVTVAGLRKTATLDPNKHL